MTQRLFHALVAVCAVSALLATPSRSADRDTALMCVTSNIAKGSPNCFLYITFLDRKVPLKSGDRLEYDVFLDPANPMASGGVDVETDEAGHIRDMAVVDQNVLRSHADSDLSAASGKWYHRSLPLDAVVRFTPRSFQIQFEGDKEGRYAQFIDNVVISRADGSRVVIYENGPPATAGINGKEGYSKYFVLTAVDRALVSDGKAREKLIADQLEIAQRTSLVEDIQFALRVAEALTAQASEKEKAADLASARAAVADAVKASGAGREEFDRVLTRASGQLAKLHPFLARYIGHIVGHAHIDFQWLWQWPETLTVCKDTFGQALRFMDEFPDFTFTQSSSSLYAATEQNFPDIFRTIQKRVQEGRWEIVGGQLAEADSNIISPESHARQFLYGQRYFRERFGKTAVVAWQPDTFGHNWQMPQIVTLGGCRYYYFCRAGKGHPMFWFESPDGTRVLAFEESAIPGGSWYNGNLTNKNFDELIDFNKQTGARDMLWVYGVGNHGGGPTREDILTGEKWKTSKVLPTSKFSTATAFFASLDKYDLSKLPVVRGEMNTIFEGCYTSHGDVKRWNRDAEASTESAEAAASVASEFGFPYPRKEFRRNWEDILWNQHHDTIDGTAVHKSYHLSRQTYTRAIRSSRSISRSAVDHLSARFNTARDGVLVFNPLAMKASGLVRLTGVDSRGLLGLQDADGLLSPAQKEPDGTWSFVARDVPSLGYKVYKLTEEGDVKSSVSVATDGSRLESPEFQMDIDPTTGAVTRVLDKKSGREALKTGGSGRLEIHWESPVGMSAWNVGQIKRVETLGGPVTISTSSGATQARVEIRRKFRDSTIVQTVSLAAGLPYVDFTLDVDWQEKGDGGKDNPFLKAAFDLNVTNPKASFDIPFGWVDRPNDNHEYPALKWADLSDEQGGASLLNDCKHGYSTEASTLRLSLIRCSYDPDPLPDIGTHHIRYALYPHAGGWREARTPEVATQYNHPLMASVKPGTATSAGEKSFLTVDGTSVLVTGVKRAEDTSDLVVRFYETDGKAGEVSLKPSFPVRSARTVNLLEDDMGAERVRSGAVVSTVRASEIRTVKMKGSAMP